MINQCMADRGGRLLDSTLASSCNAVAHSWLPWLDYGHECPPSMAIGRVAHYPISFDCSFARPPWRCAFDALALHLKPLAELIGLSATVSSTGQVHLCFVLNLKECFPPPRATTAPTISSLASRARLVSSWAFFVA